MPQITNIVFVDWDAEARVWVARSEDIPGLVTEAPSFEGLDQNVREIIPELLRLNRPSTSAGVFPYRLVRDGEVQINP